MAQPRNRGGRPRTLNEDLIKRTILHYAQDIITSQGKFISKYDKIWTTMSQEIGRIQPHALYTLVVNNRYNIKNILLNKTSETDKDLSTNNSSNSTANLSLNFTFIK